MSIKITLQEFKFRIKHLNPNVIILSDFKSLRSKILVRDEFGICNVNAYTLTQSKLSIISALDKTSYWLNKYKNLHNGKYDYSKFIYVKNHQKSIFICSEHGEFKQTPANHIKYGCEKCARKLSTGVGPYSLKMADRNFNSWKKQMVTLYLLELNDGDIFYKIGITKQSIERRFSNFPYKYKVLYMFEMSLYDATLKEKEILKIMNKNMYIPKIKFSGYKECFKYGHTPQDVLERLKSL